MAHHLWKAAGLWKPSTSSLPATSHLFFSSCSANCWSSDPEKAKAEKQRYREYREWCIQKRRTDPEWKNRKNRIEREARAKARQSWSEERLERYRKDSRESMKKRYAENPRFKLHHKMDILSRQSQWARECLPWKSHTPVLYDKKVEHICSSCLVSRHGGAKLWWKRHDGEAYKCVRCYFKSPDPMPEGYEDCKSAAEIRERSKELGHVNPRK
ncbi:hypothetical protein M438DRAFT_318905 [Aureobasidium pullulans EXF-150]|uniref:Uncharacterized protein n=1 Tax=Aureobasidium pullulans EXF-150 TaxID=1043002 RepID=A0A074XL82_AURPU|nr:uncharacterized protein M438DRAFT_318905 [Aureobasidium pullulans EXF-150]KEQ84474.1 hypothetical protein M438DRAFT_318905 [Aureobasidium pullulans EXF-150]